MLILDAKDEFSEGTPRRKTNVTVEERRLDESRSRKKQWKRWGPGGKGTLIIEDAHGNQIEMTNAKITIRGVGILDIQAPTVTINGRVVAPSANPI